MQTQYPSDDSERLLGGLSNATRLKFGSRTCFLNLFAFRCAKCLSLSREFPHEYNEFK